MRKLSKSDRQFWKDYGNDAGIPLGNAMTTEQLGEAMLRTVQAMTPDEKALLRARMWRSVGIVKSSEGRPS